MFKKLHLNTHEQQQQHTYSPPTLTARNSTTPNSRMVPLPSPSSSATTGYHAISNEYNNQYQYKDRHESYRESDGTMYSTYNLRESLVDPSNDRVVGISRETYIEPQTSTIVRTQVQPQSIYGAQYLNPQDRSSIVSSMGGPPSIGQINYFNAESSDSLHSEIRNLYPPEPIKQRVQQAESPIKMQHAYVDVPLPSAAVIEQVATASVHIEPSSAQVYQTTDYNNNEIYHSSSSHTRQHPQPLAPLVIPPTPSRSTSPAPVDQHQKGYYQSSAVQHGSPETQAYYQPQLYSNKQHDDGSQPQLTPGTGGSPYTVSPRTPSPNTLLPPQQHAYPSNTSPTLSQPPASPCFPPPTAHPGLSEKLQKQMKGNNDDHGPPQSEVERLVGEGIRYHETGNLAKATECFRQAAGMDSPIAMFLYGIALRHGWGCNRNENTAFQYLQKAAEHAVLDLNSLSTTVNTSASKGELIMAIYELGVSFRYGWGCRKNKETAVYFFKLAADLGDPDAQNDLGHCYYHGSGVKKDLYQAAKYYRMADKQGCGIMGNSWIYKPKYDKPAKS
ncbi:hypothetical protein BJV82DRAFT_611262 [Fennellomyces sp. T-0311]|nr:hypothetical protein BJV82DRAFT_611262 [Fennellomyces sp. T-0311]